MVQQLAQLMEAKEVNSNLIDRVAKLRSETKEFVRKKRSVFSKLNHQMPFGYFVYLEQSSKHFDNSFVRLSIVEE